MSIKELKQRQLSSIEVFNPQKIDDFNYVIECHLLEQIIKLNINLSTEFPYEPPTITAEPTIIHQWYSNGRFQTQKLLEWKIHTSLGNIIEEIVVEFSLRPPTLSLSKAPTIPRKPIQPISLPNFLGLESKTDDEVQELLKDESAFAIYFYNLEQVKHTKDIHDKLLFSNAELAKQNTATAQEIEELKVRIEKLQQTESSSIDKLDSLTKDYNNEYKRFSAPFIMEQLRHLVSTTEDTSEAIANSYHDGKSSEEDFLAKFMDSRILYHTFNAKLEYILENSGK